MAVLSLPNIILTNVQPTRENIHECTKLKSPLGVKWHNAITYAQQLLVRGCAGDTDGVLHCYFQVHSQIQQAIL